MFTPEVAVVMSMAMTVAAARDRRFSIPDRFGHLFAARLSSALRGSE